MNYPFLQDCSFLSADQVRELTEKLDLLGDYFVENPEDFLTFLESLKQHLPETVIPKIKDLIEDFSVNSPNNLLNTLNEQLIQQNATTESVGSLQNTVSE